MLSLANEHHYAECQFAQCHNAECRYVECRGTVIGSVKNNMNKNRKKILPRFLKMSFYTFGQCYKTFYDRKLSLFIIN